MGQKITSALVAKRAGVSEATVSYIISGKRKISRGITEKVMKIMKDLNYSPNREMRNINAKSTNTIGFFGPSTHSIRNDMFFNDLLAGILDELHSRDFRFLMFADYSEEIPEAPQPDVEIDPALNGFLVMNPRNDDRHVKALRKAGMPFVVMGNSQDNEQFSVGSDTVAGMYHAVDHLIKKGHRNILLIDRSEESFPSSPRGPCTASRPARCRSVRPRPGSSRTRFRTRAATGCRRTPWRGTCR
jgi:LacI family transcriptional regulator